MFVAKDLPYYPLNDSTLVFPGAVDFSKTDKYIYSTEMVKCIGEGLW